MSEQRSTGMFRCISMLLAQMAVCAGCGGMQCTGRGALGGEHVLPGVPARSREVQSLEIHDMHAQVALRFECGDQPQVRQPAYKDGLSRELT